MLLQTGSTEVVHITFAPDSYALKGGPIVKLKIVAFPAAAAASQEHQPLALAGQGEVTEHFGL
jgi:hypothetical protein